jgi:3-hydroxybutyryl-CoA dehydratase
MNAYGGYYFEELRPDMTASFAKTISDADLVLFAGVSGDVNPVHMDDTFAAGTRFGRRIAHGFLTGSLISTVAGTRLPGPGCIYLSQNLSFRAPVHPGDTVTARVTVLEVIPGRNRVRLDTRCTVGERTVVDGEALLWVPSRPA